MHPVITLAIAAERTGEMRAHAAAQGRGRQFRRSLRSRRLWLASGVPGSGHSQAARPAPWPLRGPRPA